MASRGGQTRSWYPGGAQVRGRYDPKLPRASDGAHSGDWLPQHPVRTAFLGTQTWVSTVCGDALWVIGAVPRHSVAGIVRSS